MNFSVAIERREKKRYLAEFARLKLRAALYMVFMDSMLKIIHNKEADLLTFYY
jgi:hypothetical protein